MEKRTGVEAFERLQQADNGGLPKPGACKKCGKVGHLSFECHNNIKLPPLPPPKKSIYEHSYPEKPSIEERGTGRESKRAHRDKSPKKKSKSKSKSHKKESKSSRRRYRSRSRSSSVDERRRSSRRNVRDLSASPERQRHSSKRNLSRSLSPKENSSHRESSSRKHEHEAFVNSHVNPERLKLVESSKPRDLSRHR